MKGSNHIPATKRELLVRLLDLGKVMIHLDSRRDGVDVPEEHGDDSDLRLNISYHFQYGDLDVGQSEVIATLSFSGRPYTCRVPIDAIFAMFSHVSGESFFFPTDAPPETLAGLAAMMAPLTKPEEDGAEGPSPGARRRRRGRPRLRAIDGGAGRAEDADPSLDIEGEGDEARSGPVRSVSKQVRTGWSEPDSSDEKGESCRVVEDESDGADATEDGATLVDLPRRFGHLRVVK